MWEDIKMTNSRSLEHSNWTEGNLGVFSDHYNLKFAMTSVVRVIFTHYTPRYKVYGGYIGVTLVCRSVCGHFLWTLFLSNHWLEFNKTSQEWLIPSLVVHIVRMLHWNNFSMSYGPLNFSYILHICTFLVNTIYLQRFVRI